MWSLKRLNQWLFHISLKKALLIVIVIGTLVSWILFNSNAIRIRSDPVPFSWQANPLNSNFECACQLNSSSVSEYSSKNSSKQTVRSESNLNVLIVSDSSRSKSTRQVVETLEYLRLGYKTVTVGKLVQFLAASKKKRFSLLVIENQLSFDSLVDFDRKFVFEFCAEFGIALISLYPTAKHTITSHQATPNEPIWIAESQTNVHSLVISNASDILKISKSNVRIPLNLTISGSHVVQLLPSNLSWNCFNTNNLSSFTSLAELIYNQPNSSHLSSTKQSPIVLLHHGNETSPSRCLFANGLNIWINRLLFVDCIGYLLSSNSSAFSLDRFVLIDIDDIFVGARGTRLRPDDVQQLIDFQHRMRALVTDFKLNLGFSGKFLHKGFDDEDFGDDALLQNAHHFWWFCHTFAHSQPHLIGNASLLENQLQLNKAFALNHNIPITAGYAVAPHHSGVYPVYEPLYQAWKSVWNISVTSTEEYPHLRPARYRKGFIFNGIRVLPRQTCGLYTHTIRLNEYPGGKDKFFRNIFGGELFFQFIFNPINVFMTHMSNYATDRLASFAFESVIKFLKCYTNLRFQTKHPMQLADKYFEWHSEEQVPLWTNPCADRRLLDIWASPDRCHRFPSLLVVGPQRSGSSALHSFLRAHPSLQSNRPSKDNFEELQFFNSRNYLKGIGWYLRHFPALQSGRQMLFEKSANYFDNELTPKRVQALLPNVRIIVLLADPIRRAYSWYQHMKFNQDPIAEQHSFYQVLTANVTSDARLRALKSRCVKPGFYAQHLERWLSFFSIRQIVLVDSQRLTTDPATVMSSVQHQLQLQPSIDYRSRLKFSRSKGFFCVTNGRGKSKLNCLGKSKGRSYEPMDDNSRQLLIKLYASHNQALIKLLNKLGQQLPNWLREASSVSSPSTF